MLASFLMGLVGGQRSMTPLAMVSVAAARLITNAIAGAALAPRRQRWIGAAVGGLTAVAASYPGWRARMAALRRYGQTPTGFVEDVAVLAGATAIIRGLEKPAAV